MTTQSQFGGEISDIDEAAVYFRPVQSKERLVEPDQQIIDTPSELSKVEELISYIKEKKLNYPLPVPESGMQEMTSDRVYRIFESDGSKRFVEDILAMFCDRLEGRQRSKDKYAMLVYMGDRYLLAHVRAERGMSIQEDGEEVELIRRFLDVDNILSAALFEDGDPEIEFSHFTDSGSDSFRNFLGVNEQHLNYRRKTIQFLCYYRGRREYDCKFEFTNDEFSDKWLRDEDIHLSGNKLEFRTDGTEDHPHEIKEIRWGNDSYESVESFKSVFKEQSLGLNIERDRYEDLLGYPAEGNSRLSVFDAEEVIDHRHEIEVIKSSGDREFAKKSDTPDNLHILYAGDNIRLDTAFADDIFTDIVNRNEIRVYHASEPPAAKSLTVKNITFLNIDEEEVSEERVKFLEETYEHALNRAGEAVKKCLLNSMLQVLQKSADQQFAVALSQIMNIYTGNPAQGSTFSTKENEGPELVEFKNTKFLEKDDPAGEVVSEIEKEIEKGVEKKVIMWGFTEQNREIDGFRSQSWGDDRVSGIEKRVKGGLNEKDIDYQEFLMQPITLDGSGERLAITGVFF